MSKVYSFRLDENNPLETQAREVIDAWVSKGYSLRHIITEALVLYQADNSNRYVLEEILEKITDMVLNFNEGSTSDKWKDESLPKEFVGSVTKSVRSGVKLE